MCTVICVECICSRVVVVDNSLLKFSFENIAADGPKVHIPRLSFEEQ